MINMGASLSNELVSNVEGLPFECTHSASGAFKEKKRLKLSGFSTLRRKFIRKRRCSKSCDHNRIIREFISTWSLNEIRLLLDEYEALAALKDLTIQAELARPPAATYKQDLSSLYDYKCCTDVDLIYRGTCYPVHRAILSARCSYFREVLINYPTYDAQIIIDLGSPAIDNAMFSALLRYLYTGDVGPRDGDVDLALLRQLGDELGAANQLEQDLRYLLETGDYADTVLVFSSENLIDTRRLSNNSEFGFRPKLELNCHKAILSARSPFFRNLIQRWSKSGEEQTERMLHVQTRIMLDESIIPKRYAKVLLHAIYLDTIDLSLILRGSGCISSAGSLGEVEALTNTGRSRPTPLEEVMELYQIGRFLELEIVTQGCEDLILEWLTLDTLPTVLRWGSQPHGSAWVHRQAKQFLCEEFSQLVNSPILGQLDMCHLVDCIQSDFLQASELEVLKAVINWSELKILKRLEEKESTNRLNHALQSVSRKSCPKRNEISDVELRELLTVLLPYVRLDHIIPPNNDVLEGAIRRGLVCTPSSHMMTRDPHQQHDYNKVHAWIRTPMGLFIRPRLFMPYYEEVKAIVEEQLAQSADLLKPIRRPIQFIPDIANTLQSDGHFLHRSTSYSSHTSIHDNLSSYSSSTSTNAATTNTAVTSTTSIPDASVMKAMVKREQKLKSAPSCYRAMCISRSSKHEINKQIRLRVVREFNLPDSVADLLEQSTSNAKCVCGGPTSDEDSWTNNANLVNSMKDDYALCTSTQQRPLPHSTYATIHKRSKKLPAIITEGSGFSNEIGNSSCNEGHLSEMMPDVAAIASTNLSLASLTLSSSLSTSSAVGTSRNLARSRGAGAASGGSSGATHTRSLHHTHSQEVHGNGHNELALDLGDGGASSFRRSRNALIPPRQFV